VPHQDAQGRWISDDGLQWWDGSSWQPIGVQVPARRGISALPAVLIGCGFALVIVIVLVVGGFVFAFNNQDFQRGFCDSWNNNTQNQGTPCPFHPSSP
jgi:hypothetical protein